jgi:hypothetical protein
MPPSAPPSASSNSRGASLELQLLHRWLDSWAGVGLISIGLHRQSWDLQFTHYGDGNWRATFYVTGAAHSTDGGLASEATAWTAVHRGPTRARCLVARSAPAGTDGLGVDGVSSLVPRSDSRDSQAS